MEKIIQISVSLGQIGLNIHLKEFDANDNGKVYYLQSDSHYKTIKKNSVNETMASNSSTFVIELSMFSTPDKLEENKLKIIKEVENHIDTYKVCLSNLEKNLKRWKS